MALKKLPDGSTVLFKKPKLRKVAAPSPAVKTNPDGSVSLGSVKLPPGTSPTADGSIALPKGTKVTKNADGTMCVDGAPLPPGMGARVNPDGSISLAPTSSLPPPPQLQTSPDGSLAVGGVKLPKGSEPSLDGSISLPKGAKVSKGKDGSVTIDGQKLPPGTTVQTNADGSLSIVSTLPPPSAVPGLVLGCMVDFKADYLFTSDSGAPNTMSHTLYAPNTNTEELYSSSSSMSSLQPNVICNSSSIDSQTETASTDTSLTSNGIFDTSSNKTLPSTGGEQHHKPKSLNNIDKHAAHQESKNGANHLSIIIEDDKTSHISRGINEIFCFVACILLLHAYFVDSMQ
jgi:hypothetical protein